MSKKGSLPLNYPYLKQLIKMGNKGRITVGKKLRILLVLGVLLMIVGTLLSTTPYSFLWRTGTVTALFTVLIFGIDPLNPRR
jgi:hypothetical protein